MNIIDFMNINSPAIIAFGSIMTVILTLIYIKQINKQRHEMVKPHILLDTIYMPKHSDVLDFRFKNVGMGDAFDVQIECLFFKNAILKKLSKNYFKYLFEIQFIKVNTRDKIIRHISTKKDSNIKCIHIMLLPETVERKLIDSNCGCVKIKLVYIDQIGKKQKTKKYYNLNSIKVLWEAERLDVI